MIEWGWDGEPRLKGRLESEGRKTDLFTFDYDVLYNKTQVYKNEIDYY